MKFITLLLVSCPILALSKNLEATGGNMMSTRERVVEEKVHVADNLPTTGENNNNNNNNNKGLLNNAGKDLAAVVASHGKRTNRRRFLKTGLPPAKGKGKGNGLITKGRSEGVNDTNVDDDGCPFLDPEKC